LTACDQISIASCAGGHTKQFSACTGLRSRKDLFIIFNEVILPAKDVISSVPYTFSENAEKKDQSGLVNHQ